MKKKARNNFLLSNLSSFCYVLLMILFCPWCAVWNLPQLASLASSYLGRHVNLYTGVVMTADLTDRIFQVMLVSLRQGMHGISSLCVVLSVIFGQF